MLLNNSFTYLFKKRCLSTYASPRSIFNQPSNKDRLSEADATRQGYGSVFGLFAIWNIIADYARKERLLKEPIRLNQLPAEAVWFGVKSSTLGIVAGVGLIVLRFIIFGLLFYLFNLNRDIANLIYLLAITALSLMYFKTLADYLRYPDGMTDTLIKININCVVSSVVTVEIMKLVGILYAFISYGQIVSLMPESAHSEMFFRWFYNYFLDQPWKLLLEEWFIVQVIISGMGLVEKRRGSLEERVEFDLEGIG